MKTPAPPFGLSLEQHLIRSRQMRAEFLREGARAIGHAVVRRWRTRFGKSGSVGNTPLPDRIWRQTR